MAVLATRSAQEYPQAAVLCVDAPDAFDAAPGGGGRQWFSIQGIDEAEPPGARAAALPRFIATVRALQLRFAIDWPRTALFGFSQGAIMALEAAQAEPELAGRVIAFSGRYATLPGHAPRDTLPCTCCTAWTMRCCRTAARWRRRAAWWRWAPT